MGCDSKNEESSHEETYDEDTYKFLEYNVASLISADQKVLNTPPKLNGFGVTTIGDSWSQIRLTLSPKNVEWNVDDPFVWGLVFTTNPEVNGSVSYDDLEIRLFYNYLPSKGYQGWPPYNEIGSADVSYIPVSGYVDFESLNKGTFSLDFQRETFVGSNVTEGDIVNIRGCWNKVYGEQGGNGCIAY